MEGIKEGRRGGRKKESKEGGKRGRNGWRQEVSKERSKGGRKEESKKSINQIFVYSDHL